MEVGEFEKFLKKVCKTIEKETGEKCGIDNECWCRKTVAAYHLGAKEEAGKILSKVCEIICSFTYPDFDRKGKPINVWSANGYKLIADIAAEYDFDLREENDVSR